MAADGGRALVALLQHDIVRASREELGGIGCPSKRRETESPRLLRSAGNRCRAPSARSPRGSRRDCPSVPCAHWGRRKSDAPRPCSALHTRSTLPHISRSDKRRARDMHDTGAECREPRDDGVARRRTARRRKGRCCRRNPGCHRHCSSTKALPVGKSVTVVMRLRIDAIRYQPVEDDMAEGIGADRADEDRPPAAARRLIDENPGRAAGEGAAVECRRGGGGHPCRRTRTRPATRRSTLFRRAFNIVRISVLSGRKNRRIQHYATTFDTSILSLTFVKFEHHSVNSRRARPGARRSGGALGCGPKKIGTMEEFAARRRLVAADRFQVLSRRRVGARQDPRQDRGGAQADRASGPIFSP